MATEKPAKKKAKRKKRARGTSPHPGVVLKARTWKSGKVSWFARYVDPDTDKVVDANLTKMGLTNETARSAWAKNKSKAIAEIKQAIEAGTAAPPKGGKVETVAESVEDYLERAALRLRPATVTTYKVSLEHFKDWCEDEGIRQIRQIKPTHLARLSDFLAALPRQKAHRGGKLDSPRTPASINRDLRAIKIFLGDQRDRGYAPRIDAEAIRKRAKPVKRDHPQPQPLRAAEIRALLKAAIRHDRDRYVMTRKEKDGDGKPGSTVRNLPVAPLTLATLLTGCRIGELRLLPWTGVHLDPGSEELVVLPTACKTRRERRIDISICPSLVQLLARMRLVADEAEYVFGPGDEPLTAHWPSNAIRRLIASYGAPPSFCWQRVRQTTASYLTNAASLFGASSAFQSAKRCGHSVQVAEKNYADLVRNIPARARTLEAAMRIGDLARQIAGGDMAATDVAQLLGGIKRRPSRRDR